MRAWIVSVMLAVCVSACSQSKPAAVPQPATVAAAPAPDPAPPQAAPPATANDGVIKMAQAGMTDDIILSVVAKTDKTTYDTSTDGLLKMKSAGVSDKVIGAILGVPASIPATSPKTQAPVQRTPVPSSAPAETPKPAAPKSANEPPSIPREQVPTARTDSSDASVPEGTHFTIFISAPERDGFFDTSKDVQDSIKDIGGKIAKQKSLALTVAKDQPSADIVLTVVERGIGNQAYGERVSFQRYYGGSALEDTPMVASTFWVSTMMQVGPRYKKEFTGKWTQNAGIFTMGAWGNCADQISKNVVSWVATNAALINRNRK